MRLAVISDIHSNLEALNTAFREIDSRGVDAIYCLGDIVGYGAEASPCIDIVRERCTGVVAGNHDQAVAIDRGVSFLPKDAQKAVFQNREQLSEDQLHYLAGLPLLIEENDCCFVHASPQHPASWLRIESMVVAMDQFKYFESPVCFIGHTHIPAVMSDQLGVLRVRKGHRFLINVGSVGQPRDQNPRLSLAFYETEAMNLDMVRLPYDTEKTIQSITNAGLPRRLGQRLKAGL
ncbi:MAG: metallophosphoesterase family protein [Rhodothermales bacterium]|nr:metallophosphoesterase family protein [Rhodothermales bacterium]